jgi:hypothetical protein
MSKSSSTRASKLTALIGASVLLTGSLATGIGASANPPLALPESDRVYVLPCDRFQEPDGHLFEVDTRSGTSTRDAIRVGSWDRPTDADLFEGASKYGCASSGSYNPKDGLAYWASWTGEEYLISIDLKTGINTVVGAFKTMKDVGGVQTLVSVSVNAIAINSDGEAWVTSGSENPSNLYSLDLNTGLMTLVGPTKVEEGADNADRNLNYIAWDPVTDKVYGYNSGSKYLYTVNTETGEFTKFSSTQLFGGFDVYALTFDSAGQVWGANVEVAFGPLSDLSRFERFSLDFTENGYIEDGTGVWDIGQVVPELYILNIMVAPAASASTPVATPVAAPVSNYFIAVGFDKGKAKLKKPMRAFIRKELNSRSGEVRALCVGTVRGKKWTPKRKALALARAASGCDYVTKLNPGLPVELKKRLIAKGKGNPLTVRIRVFY